MIGNPGDLTMSASSEQAGPLALPEVSEPLTQADYELLKGAFRCYRDLLLCKLLRGTGVRVSELLRITPEYVGDDGPHTYILVQRGKKQGTTTGGNKLYERVYLHPQLALELKDFIKGSGTPRGGVVFHIGLRQTENIMNTAGLAALGRTVHPHQFRHLYVKTLLDGGVPAPAAAKMVGHTDSRTTEKWYYELSRQQRWEIQRRIPV